MAPRQINLKLLRNDGGVTIITGKYATSNTDISPCVCVGQAWYAATRGKPDRKNDEVVLTDYQGNVIERADWPKCSVERHSWTWQHHGFTHVATGVGHTDRIARAQHAEDSRLVRR